MTGIDPEQRSGNVLMLNVPKNTANDFLSDIKRTMQLTMRCDLKKLPNPPSARDAERRVYISTLITHHMSRAIGSMWNGFVLSVIQNYTMNNLTKGEKHE